MNISKKRYTARTGFAVEGPFVGNFGLATGHLREGFWETNPFYGLANGAPRFVLRYYLGGPVR